MLDQLIYVDSFPEVDAISFSTDEPGISPALGHEHGLLVVW